MGCRWRTELDLNRGKSLDHDHRTAAQRTGPKRCRLGWRIRVSGWGVRSRGRAGGEYLFTQRNQGATAAAGQKTEVPDTDKAARQHMQQEATQELIDV